MSMKDYTRTLAPAPRELKAMQAKARKTRTNELSRTQINRIVSTVRRNSGRRHFKTPRQMIRLVLNTKVLVSDNLTALKLQTAFPETLEDYCRGQCARTARTYRQRAAGIVPPGQRLSRG